MNINRHRVVEVLTLTIIGLLIYINCRPLFATNDSDKDASITQGKKEQFASFMATYQDRVVLLQSKFLIGINELSRDITSTPELNQKAFQIGNEELKKMVSAFVLSFPDANNVEHSPLAQNALAPAKYLAVAKYFKHAELETELCGKIRQSSATTPLLLLLAKQCDSASPLTKLGAADVGWQFSEIDRKLLHDELSWFGDLLIYSSLSDNTPEKNKAYQDYIAQTKDFALSFSLFIGLFMIAFTLSIIALPIVVLQLVRGKFNFQLQRNPLAAPYLLETFALYTGGMLLVGKVLGKLNLDLTSSNMLRLNIVIISSFGLFALWPLLFNIRLRDLISTLGIPNLLPHRFLNEVCVGFFSYIIYLPVMFVVLILYSVLLTKFNIDPSSGTHPIVPLVTGESGGEDVFNLVFILAVCVAPIIEELMFRGAYYGWLRTRLPSFVAILICAVTFAAVHPQGIIGILPLTCVGVLLAFLREWRGTLTASMTAHACNNALMLSAVNYLFR